MTNRMLAASVLAVAIAVIAITIALMAMLDPATPASFSGNCTPGGALASMCHP